MRKLALSLFFLISFLFVANFGVWYLNNRAVAGLVTEIRESLSKQGYSLEYDNLVFDTFKSWDIKGALLGVKFKNHQNTYSFKLDRVNFGFDPIDREFKLVLAGISKYNMTQLGMETDAFLNYSHENPPTLKVVLNIPTHELMSILLSGDISKISQVRDVDFNAKNISFIDVKTNKNTYVLENISLTAKSELSEEKDSVNTDVRFNWTALNENVENNNAIFLPISGRSSIESVIKAKTYIQEDADNVELNVESIKYFNDKFSLNLSGILKNQDTSMMPYIDAKFSIDKFDEFLNVYIESANAFLKTPEGAEILRMKPFTDAEKNNIRKNLASYITKDGEFVLDVKTDDNKELIISGKPMREVFMALQMYVLERAGMIAPQPTQQFTPANKKSK